MYAPRHEDCELINRLRKAGPNDSRVEAVTHSLTIASAAFQAFRAWTEHFNDASNTQRCEHTRHMLASQLDLQRMKAKELLLQLEKSWFHVAFMRNGEHVHEIDLQAEDEMDALQQGIDILNRKVQYTQVLAWQRATHPEAGNVGFQQAVLRANAVRFPEDSQMDDTHEGSTPD